MSSEHTSRGLFPKSDFRYSKEEDAYICPVGQRLKPKRHHKRRQMTDYVADPKICAACSLREQCTRGKKLGRSVARHWKEGELLAAQQQAHTPQAFAARRRRRHLMEGSFAQAANRHHFKRARWRRLWRQQIQDWLIAAAQNIAILGREQGARVAARRRKPAGPARTGSFFRRRQLVWRRFSAAPSSAFGTLPAHTPCRIHFFPTSRLDRALWATGPQGMTSSAGIYC